jgi:hypothetical protein
MNAIGEINGRRIFYYDNTDYPKLSTLLPINYWVLLTIADEEQIALLPTLAKTCLDKKVRHLCGVGEAAEDI